MLAPEVCWMMLSFSGSSRTTAKNILVSDKMFTSWILQPCHHLTSDQKQKVRDAQPTRA